MSDEVDWNRLEEEVWWPAPHPDEIVDGQALVVYVEEGGVIVLGEERFERRLDAVFWLGMGVLVGWWAANPSWVRMGVVLGVMACFVIGVAWTVEVWRERAMKRMRGGGKGRGKGRANPPL